MTTTTTTAHNMVVHTTQEAPNHSKVGWFCLLYEALLLNVSDVTKTSVMDSSLSGSDAVMVGELFLTV
jgi:hypothetical protein